MRRGGRGKRREYLGGKENEMKRKKEERRQGYNGKGKR